MGYEFSGTEAYSVQQLNDAYYEILLKLTREMSVKQVVDYLADILGQSVLLYTKTGTHIFSSCNNAGSRRAMLLLQSRLATKDKFNSYLEQARTTHTETNYSGVYLDYYETLEFFALSSDLIAGNNVIGTLCLLDVDASDYQEQAETFNLFSRILPKKLSASESLNLQPDRIERADINRGAKWVRKIKGDLFQNFYLAVIHAPDALPANIQQLKSDLERNHFLFRLVEHQPYIVILFNVQDSDEAELMCAALSQFSREYSLPIGLSYRFSTTASIHDCFQQAATTLQVSEYLKLEPQLLQFERYNVYTLLCDMMHTADLDCYRNEALDDLQREDDKNGTQLYKTLKAFISCGGSKQKASQALYIHRNTLSYRLEQIADILHMDINNTDVQTRLYLDIRIKEVLDRQVS